MRPHPVEECAATSLALHLEMNSTLVNSSMTTFGETAVQHILYTVYHVCLNTVPEKAPRRYNGKWEAFIIFSTALKIPVFSRFFVFCISHFLDQRQVRDCRFDVGCGSLNVKCEGGLLEHAETSRSCNLQHITT